VTSKKPQGQDATAPVDEIAAQPEAVATGKLLIALSAPMYTPVGGHVTIRLQGRVETVNAPDGANAVLVQANASGVRYTLDGSEPTSKRGFRLGDGAPVLLPVSGPISVVDAKPGAILEAQFVRMV
jgi:hypothetical protein